MIVSASYRTDVPAFYAPWFLNRLEVGFARVANPYGGPAYEVSLRPGDVDGFVLWTRNMAPLAPHLPLVRRCAPFVVQFTVTAYPRTLESSVIDSDRAVEQIRAIRRAWGPRAAVWRYDPILVTTATPLDWHVATFARLAGELAGSVDEACVSFANIYRKTRRNLDAVARRYGGIDWRDPDADEKQALLTRLAPIAADRGMVLTLCTQPDLLVAGVGEARCVDAARLSDVAGRSIGARQKGNRPGCLCAESRDIGAYDTCPHGCAYCYAVADRDRAVAGYRAHEPTGPFLVPPTRDIPSPDRPPKETPP